MKKLLSTLFVAGLLLSANSVVYADHAEYEMQTKNTCANEYTYQNNDCKKYETRKNNCKTEKKDTCDNYKSAKKCNDDCDYGCEKEKDPCDPCKKNNGFFGFFRNMFHRN